MAFILKDRVKESTTTTGTGNISLGGALATFETFQSYLSNGDTTFYAIAHTSSGVDEWEVGLGTWNTGNTLSRTTVLAGSNGTSAVTFSAGTKDVFMTYPASKAIVSGEDAAFANITVTGTVDGRDIAADGTKLDGVEASADVTDAVTVAAAGALMRSGGTMTGNLVLNANPSAALGAATKQYVDTEVSSLVDSAPSTLDTLNELAAALGDDANFSTTVTNSIATKLPLAGGTLTGNLSMGDTVKATFGAGSDLEIFHWSNNASYIQEKNPTGSLFIEGADIYLRSYSEGDNMIVAQRDGAVTLYYDNAAKLATTTTGIDVTGNATFADNGKAIFGAGSDLQIYHDGSNSYIKDTATGNLNISGNDIQILNAASNEAMAYFAQDGDVTLYHNGVAKLATTSTGIDVTGTVTADGLTVDGDVLAAGLYVGSANTSYDFYNNGTTYLNGATTIDANTTINGSLSITSDINVGAQTGTWITSNVMSDAIGWNTNYGVYIGSDIGGTHYLRGNGTFTTGGSTYNLFHDGYHPNADAWTTARTLSLTGDVTGSVSWDGSGNASLAATVANDSHTHDGRYYTESEADSRFLRSDISDVYAGRVLEFGIAGNGQNTNSAFLTIEGNTDTSGEGSGRIMFREHNSTTASADSYGMSLGYRGGATSVTTAMGNSWTGLSQIGNGEWGMWGHNNNATGALIAHGPRSGAYTDFTGLKVGGNNVFHDGYHPNADKWTTSRTLTLSGDASGSVSWDGSANATLSVTVADDSHNHTWTNIDGGSVNPWGGLRHSTSSGYIDFGPANTSWAHIYTDRANFYFNQELYVNNKRVYNTGYHPEADKWTTARTLSLSGDASGSVSWDGSANATLSVAVADDSHTHDGRYYTESEVDTFINRSYVSKHSATSLAVGWYTIAQNTGDRAVARFALWDTNSSDHQSVIFYASHHFGTDGSNTLTVLDNSYYSGNPFRYIRIKDAGTYDGAALQVYIDDASNSVNIAIVGDDVQSTGWDIVDFLADASAPSLVSNWANFGERARIDLNQIAQGGLVTTGPIYADGDTTQYRVFNDNYHPNADTLTTARTINGVSFNGSANITVADSTKLPLAGGTMTGELQLNARLDVGSGTQADAEIRVYKGDNNVSDHIQFYNGTTRVGEIGCEDTSWLRINQETAKNIYTPRYMRADGGFFVDSTAKGINGSGNFIGGTITGASDANVSNWDAAYTTANAALPKAGGTMTGHVSFNDGYSINRVEDVWLDGKLGHYGDSDTWFRFHSSNQCEIVCAGAQIATFYSSGGGSGGVITFSNLNYFQVNSDIRATGNITAYYSDERLKTKTGNIENAIDKVNSLEGFYYVENDLARSFGYDSNQRQVALSAQQVQAVMPECVSLAPFDIAGREDFETDEKLEPKSKSGENYLTVDYAKLVPLLIEAVKEQQDQIETLKSRLEKLEN